MNRADVFEGTGPTPGSYIRVKLGADKDGRLDRRPRPTWPTRPAPSPARRSGRAACASSPATTSRTSSSTATTSCVNKPATSAYRAPGATNAAFASETVVDEICEKLKIDPLEFRLKNGAKEGTRRADGPVYPRIGMIETRRGGQEARRTTRRRSARRRLPRGRGVAVGLLVQHRPEVERHGQRQRRRHRQPGRRLDRHRRHAHLASPCSWPRRSASAPRTSRPVVGDTDTVGYTDVTGGSRVTFATGLAAYEAGPGHQAADDRPRRPHLGGRSRTTSPTRTASLQLQERRGEAADVQGAGRASCTTPAAPSSAGPASIRRASAAASPRTSSTSRSIPRPAR